MRAGKTVPSEAQFLNAQSEKERLALQQQTKKALSHPSKSIRFGVLFNSRMNQLPQYPLIAECICTPLFNRRNRNNARTLFSNTIFDIATSLKTESLHIAAIGSGALLNELFLLALLASSDTLKQIKLDYVDTFYPSDSFPVSPKIRKVFTTCTAALTWEFLMIVHYGLGFNIETIAPKSNATYCAIMMTTLAQFANQIHQRDNAKSLQISFVCSAQAYADNIAATKEVPDIVNDIDFMPTEKRYEAMSPTKASIAACKSGNQPCFWVSGIPSKQPMLIKT